MSGHADPTALRTLAVSYAGLLGGAERTLLDFASALPGETALACPEGPLAKRARELGLRVFPIRARGLDLRLGGRDRVRAVADLAGHARDVRRLVAVLRPGLLLAWGMRSAIAAPAALAGLGPRPGLLIRHVDFLPGPQIARLMRGAAARADAVSVNSRAVAADLDPHGRLAGRLSVIAPGVELDRYDPAWDGAAAEPEVLVLGALEPWKRVDLALEAVALARHRLAGLTLTVAGEPISARGERLAAELRRRAELPDLAGRVRFAGQLEDPRPALSRAWCVLHCADSEPFGSVVVQALAAGRPVVAPAAGGPAEIVTADCGRLYAPGDPGAAANALVDVLASADSARALGRRARERAEHFRAGDARARFAEVALEAARIAPSPAADERPGSGMALVTVTHDSAAEVGLLLESARRHLPAARAIVIDSGSRDDSAAVARAAGAQVVELGENVGFGRASNAGVALAEEPVCALVNPDVELIDASLAALAADLVRPGAPDRLLGPLVLSPDGSRQDTAQLDPRSALLALRALVPPAVLPPSLRRAFDPWTARRPRRTGWAVGACIVARTETLRRLGPFDERIFLFGEDMDLGMRAGAAGVETWFRPDATVLHLDAHSTGRAFGGEPVELLARRRRAVIGERRGERAARRDHWTWLVTYVDRILLKTLTGRSSARERRQLAAQWASRRAPATLDPPGAAKTDRL